MKKVHKSNNSIGSAIFKSLMIYVVGFSITALIYYSIDYHYAHAPGPHHLTFLLTIGIGFFKLIGSIGKYFGNNEREMRGHIMVNGIAVFSFLVWWMITMNPKPEEEKNEISVETNGDTTTVYHNLKPIYMKIADSVYFDFRNPEFMKIEEY